MRFQKSSKLLADDNKKFLREKRCASKTRVRNVFFSKMADLGISDENQEIASVATLLCVDQ